MLVKDDVDDFLLLILYPFFLSYYFLSIVSVIGNNVSTHVVSIEIKKRINKSYGRNRSWQQSSKGKWWLIVVVVIFSSSENCFGAAAVAAVGWLVPMCNVFGPYYQCQARIGSDERRKNSFLTFHSPDHPDKLDEHTWSCEIDPMMFGLCLVV